MSSGAPAGPERATPCGSSRRAGAIAIASLVASCLFLASPAIVGALLLGSRSPGPRPLVAWSVATSVLWLVALHGLVRRPELLHLGLAPLYVTAAADLFLVLRLDSRLTSTHWTVFLTDFGDVPDFLRAHGRATLGALTALFAGLAFLLWSMTGLRLSLPRWVRRGSVLLLLLAYGIPLAWMASGRTVAETFREVASRDFSSPVGAISQAVVAGVRLHETSNYLDRRWSTSLGATRPGQHDSPEIFVWVIGDSSRPDRWSLGGYRRETNPLLAAVENVLFLPDVVTPAPYTGYAVAAMLSLAKPEDWEGILSRPSIVRAFADVGFETWWLSAQGPDSSLGVVHRIAGEARVRRYLERRRDDALVEEFRAMLASPDLPRRSSSCSIREATTSAARSRRRSGASPSATRADAPTSATSTMKASCSRTGWFRR